jgi:hypothetical protein
MIFCSGKKKMRVERACRVVEETERTEKLTALQCEAFAASGVNRES